MSILGTRVVRTEDPKILTVGGTYVDDLREPELQGAARVIFVRSPIAHARITGIDTAEALQAPGGEAAPMPLGGAWQEPLLAFDKVRFVGEPVAIVVCDDSYSGADAAELVSV